MNNVASLAGKVAVVTGASRGIGKGIATLLGERGATVYVSGRSTAAAPGATSGTINEIADDITATSIQIANRGYGEKMLKDSKHASTALPDARLTPRTDIAPEAVKNIAGSLTAVLADVFALYLKTKNFHWHMSGSHFRDYHLLLDEHGDQLLAMTDDIAERARKNRWNYNTFRWPHCPSEADRR
jgi:hypothetical protein